MKVKGEISAVLHIADDRLAESIRENIEVYGTFTNVVQSAPQKIASKGLALLCLNVGRYDEPVTYLCILKKQGRVATAQARVKGLKCLALEKVIPAELIQFLPENQKTRAAAYFNDNYRQFSPKLGEHLYRALKLLMPELSKAIDDLYETMHRPVPRRIASREQDAAVEKDALGLTLDIFGVDRSAVFRSWSLNGEGLGNSFLSGLKEFAVYEDDVINYDLRSFPGFDTVSGDHITGLVEFESEDGEKLTVINANRKPLEKAMGIDLIYFHRKYESFVMVQYKMMDQRSEEHTGLYFNPNQGSHDEELKRLKSLKTNIAAQTKGSGLTAYRFSDCALFFKLCKKFEMKWDDDSVAPGMYIPLDQWELLLTDDSTLGRAGGRQFGYHTLGKRYLSKETFVDLVQAGLIGTCDEASKKIAAFVEDAIAQGHSVMYAVDERKGDRLSRKQQIRKKRNIADDVLGDARDYSIDDEPPF
ncbi:hypothetical protein SAMN05428975_0317 [Mucilaginibacter sp. OK268]|uniref:hypothetical protein n=1 Tax=Mucilaginibacter sp. OK268 TaxID=1881048 RepID=UPI00088BFAFB|nr:hypothetical protein [Mucilaginibacter sp. OK268]SDP10421.1 hypothetical protein SAMN05428975_0317 [Mucilaginibacter sp. OK268]